MFLVRESRGLVLVPLGGSLSPIRLAMPVTTRAATTSRARGVLCLRPGREEESDGDHKSRETTTIRVAVNDQNRSQVEKWLGNPVRPPVRWVISWRTANVSPRLVRGASK